MAALHDVVVKPLVTEKSSAAYQNRKEYAFHVATSATKRDVKAALEKKLQELKNGQA